MFTKINISLFCLILFVLLTKSQVSFGKKTVSVNGKLYECKAPKNSFERTRGVRGRICIFSKENKKIIDNILKQKNLRK